MDGERDHPAGIASGLPGAPAPCRGLCRRDFLEQAFRLAAAGLLVGCAANATSATVPQFTINIGDYPPLLNVGGIAVLPTNLTRGKPIAVSRTGADTFVALSLVCPHRGFTVEAVSGTFYCPGHGAEFAATGAWTGGQPTSNLSTYPVQYDSAAASLTIG